jgi:cardiolipin synthase
MLPASKAEPLSQSGGSLRRAGRPPAVATLCARSGKGGSVAVEAPEVTWDCVRHARRYPRLRGLRLVAGLLLLPAVAAGVLVDAQVAQGASASNFRLLVEPHTGLAEIYSLIDSATSSINMTMYELADQTAEADLAAAAARHVDVRVILDRDYDGGSVNRAAYSYLSSHGVGVHWAPSDVIFHEKAFTVDNSVAAIGTGNLTAKYYATDRDYWLIDSDPPDVSAIDATFTSDWAGDPVGPSAPGADLVWSPGSEPRIMGLISSATHSVEFESEELSDRSVVDALADDARRGVTCEVLMEATRAWNSSFATLEAAGCKVRTYPHTASLYIHAKAILVDAGTSAAQLFVGSQNASVASLTYDRELGAILRASEAAPIIDDVASVFAQDFNGAKMDSTLSGWAKQHKATLSSLARTARSIEKHATAQMYKVLAEVLKRAKKLSPPPSASSAWRTAVKTLGAASMAYGTSTKTAGVNVRHGVHALARLARVLVDHDDRFGNTMLVTLGLARIKLRTNTRATSPPTAVPSNATTTTTTTAPPPPPTTTTTAPPTTTTAPPTGPSCTVSATPADDGYAGDYYVYVSSNQPYTEAIAHDATDSWTDETNGTGSVRILLYYQSPGEAIAVTVGPAHCSTTA